MDECKERRDAEIEFVQSAYSPEEAWCEPDNNDEIPRLIRRLTLTSSFHDDAVVPICLKLTLPLDYPTKSCLQVDCAIGDNAKNSSLLKSALNGLPNLVASCREVAEENKGEEAVFLVLNQAEEWIQDEWPSFQSLQQEEKLSTRESNQTSFADGGGSSDVILGRRLIYSHHIISKIKRADIKSLSSHYNLTGYMKVGWPGLLIIEGNEEDCIAFYDEIRPWNWQYLVVRGEQQETITSGDLDSHRKFSDFLEVEDMSLVAQHCKSVGLEALFRTSMKVYDNSSNSESAEPDDNIQYYGAMIHVDHMNNPKGYRKWIRKTSQETDCHVLVKQSYFNQDYSERPRIIVGIFGVSRDDVSGFLKRWRTSRVDVDSRGKPCYERQISVAVEGFLTMDQIKLMDWDGATPEDNVTVPEEHLAELLESIGGLEWKEAFKGILGRGFKSSGD